jgi:hypothetical protein
MELSRAVEDEVMAGGACEGGRSEVSDSRGVVESAAVRCLRRRWRSVGMSVRGVEDDIGWIVVGICWLLGSSPSEVSVRELYLRGFARNLVQLGTDSRSHRSTLTISMSSSKATASSKARADPKRKRTASTASEAVTSDPTPSPTYFYEDGNVILHVGQTLYKVHRSILSQAEVFRDTLLVGTGSTEAGPSSGARGERGDELATIRLDDEAADFEVFLKAMYDS